MTYSRLLPLIALAITALFSLSVSAEGTKKLDVVPESYVAPRLHDVGAHYAALASEVFTDSTSLALEMREDIHQFLDAPQPSTLAAARSSWTEARKIYGLSEVFRFSHPIVDAWEPQVNAWPLDEGLIDYVDNSNYFYDLGNPVGKANLIANTALTIGPETLDISTLSPSLLASLNELGGTEANVATGWHAIEFLLWGQDLNGTNAGAGNRPYTDFVVGKNCTHQHCERRRAYLRQVTQLLVDDLEFMTAQWAPESKNYRAAFLAMPLDQQLRRILYGVGSLALGELAGERMKVALYANSPEDEHDCFSDTTHNTLNANAKALVMVIRGEYASQSGKTLTGPSLLQWSGRDPLLQKEMSKASRHMLGKLADIVSLAEAGQPFDQLIAPGNEQGKTAINAAIDSLVTFTLNIEKLASLLELGTLSPDSAGHEF